MRIITLGSFALYAGSLVLLSFLHNFYAYIAIYGIANGLFLGIPYILPINNACQYLPKRKGLVSGICIMGLGFGALLFNQIIVAIMNPDNLPPDEKHFFPQSVADHLPTVWRALAGVYLGLAIIGTAIMVPKQKETKSEDKQSLLSENGQDASYPNECQNLKDALTQPTFYVYVVFIALSSCFGMFIAFNYKEYGLNNIKDDQFLTLVGSMGGIANGLSRIFWGTLLDCFSFKWLMTIVNVLLLAAALSIQFLADQKAFFMVYVILIYFLYGGQFSLMPAKTYQIYGQKNGARVYSYAFFGFSLGSMMQFLLHYFLVNHYGQEGWNISFYILSALQLIAFVIALFAQKFDMDWRAYYAAKQN